VPLLRAAAAAAKAAIPATDYELLVIPVVDCDRCRLPLTANLLCLLVRLSPPAGWVTLTEVCVASRWGFPPPLYQKTISPATASLRHMAIFFLEMVSFNGRDHATGCSLHEKIQREDGATWCDTPTAPLVQEHHHRAMWTAP
jgi:hypothetical protein